jgi:hypothetical protein
MRVRRHLIGFACFVAAVGLPGCAPLLPMEPASPNGPKISDLEIVGPPAAGCPITLRVHLGPFRGEVDQALVGWVRLARRAQMSQYTTLAIRRDASALILAPLTLERGGAYAYQVQVSDRQGRWSNVLSGRMAVDAASDGDARCS